MFMLMWNAQNERTVTPQTLQLLRVCCKIPRGVLGSDPLETTKGYRESNKKPGRRFTCLCCPMCGYSYVFVYVKRPEWTNRDPSTIAISILLLSSFPWCVGISFSLETAEEYETPKTTHPSIPKVFRNSPNIVKTNRDCTFPASSFGKHSYFRASHWYMDNRICPACTRHFEPRSMLNVHRIWQICIFTSTPTYIH